jgi:HEAT repeat protein
MLDTQKFLADLQSDNAQVRFTAWRQAAEASPSVIPQLGRLAASDKPGVAKAAREALATLAHSVGADPAAAARPAVVKGLLGLTALPAPLPVRVHAIRLLSNLAGAAEVPALAQLLADQDLREEAVFALERIPADASVSAIAAAFPQAPDAFKPRLLAALGHRRASQFASLCAAAMRSANPEIAVAAVKALGRIGTMPAGSAPHPEMAGLAAFQQSELFDAHLRLAEAQARAGNAAEALRLYRPLLARPEEHLQCAAVIGIAKIGTSEAAAALLPLLKSANPRVRITAQTAWQGMAGI